MPGVLITGAGGFIGSHLAELCLARGWEVIGTVHESPGNLEPILDRIVAHRCDVLDAERLRRVLAANDISAVFHLAASSLPLRSWEQPRATFETNVVGTQVLLDAVRAERPAATVVVMGSSSEYGAVEPSAVPIPEDAPLAPLHPYGVSKVAADLLAAAYARAYALRIIRVRPFFVIGPRKVGDLCSDVARAIVSAERSGAGSIKVGTTAPTRDFLDVADAAEALLACATKATAGDVYNVCSGTGTTVAEVVERLAALARVALRIVEDPARLRPADEPILVGDNRKLVALGWQPTVSLDTSLARILDYWRGRDTSDS